MSEERNELAALEQKLTRAASEMSYPPTPDLVASWGATASAPARTRLAWAAAVLIVGIVAIVAVPPVRATVVEILGIGSVQVEVGPSRVDGQAAISELPGETTLARAVETSPFDIRIPRDLGTPDRVFVLQQLGGSVVLVWERPDSQQLARIALYMIPAGELVRKLAPETVEQTEVSGQPALWTTGDHFLELVTEDPDKRLLVSDSVLIWTENGITYRLETGFSLDEAIRVAESLE